MEPRVTKFANIPAIQNDGFVWIDLQKPRRDDFEIVANEFGLHELNIEDSLSKIQLPKIDRYQDHIFMILHFPTPEGERDIPHPSQLSFFAAPHYLVTVHQGELKPLSDLFQRCESDKPQRDELMGRSSGYLIHTIVDALIDDMLHLTRKIIDKLEGTEGLVFDERLSATKQIALIRREITSLRRVLLPMKRTLGDFISRDMQRVSEEDLTSYFGDVMDHLDKVIDIVDEAKETIEIYKDTDFKLSAEKSNKILAILTIVFTYTIPSTVLGSFFGLNIPIPGSLSDPWTFLGTYTTMVVVLIGSAIPAIFMHIYFRRRGWYEQSY
jgi:magnesium transporter